MTYEIPQALEYQEKIIFGLTFQQLVYAIIFSPIAIALFFKTPFNITIRSILALIPCLIASAFMFFNLSTIIKDYLNWFRLRNPNEQKINKYVGIKEIKDNLILTDKKIAVLKVNSINFEIKSEGEKEAIIASFQKLLNSIDFPIQILANTDVLEIDTYLNKLKKRVLKKEIYQDLYQKYTKHLKDTVKTNEIMDRHFYIVIPEKSDINIQVKICTERLLNLNLKVNQLNTKELEILLNNLPHSIENKREHIKINDTYNRIIYAHGYPRSVEAGFLDRLISLVGNFDISIHIEPFEIETMMITLNKELQKQRADLFASQSKEIINPSLEIKYEDTRKILEELQKGKDKLFNISLYVNCKSEDKDKLDLLTRKIESELNSVMMIPKRANFKMAQGYKSMLPLAQNKLNISRNITTYALSAFFPFTSPFLQLDDTGVWLGLNKNNIPIIKDIFKLSNPNGVILAASGSGKSFFSKLLIARYLLNGTKVIVVDPQGEYKHLVKAFGGQRVYLSRTSKTMINPLDLMGHDYAEKRLSLMDLMPVMLGELTEPQKSFIDRAITIAYEKRAGITHLSETWKNTPPILGDVLTTLISMEKEALTFDKTTLRSLINRLRLYVDGVFSFMNQQTNINFNNNFVCFDIGDMPKQVKPLIMFLVLDYVYMKMRKSLDRKLLVIDEAWSLLSRTEDASYIFEIVKTCRKFNMGLLMINQEVEGLLNSEAGKSVLANSAYTLLMKQKPAVMKSVQETFCLSKAERINLLSASVGEGLLLMEDDHTEIKVVASKEEHDLITTNADEINAIEKSESSKKAKPKKQSSKSKKPCTTKKKANTKTANSNLKKKSKTSQKAQRTPVKSHPKLKPKVSINVDENQGFYRHKDLNLAEIKYLMARKFQEITKKSIVSGKVERFMIRPRFNESMEHMFLIYDIAEYIENKGISVRKLTTKKPDIVFEINKNKVAIEVETGVVYEKARKHLFEKIKMLKQDYDHWFFVVSNKRYLPKYKKLGVTIDKRYLANYLDKLIKKLQISPAKMGLKRRVHRRQKGAKLSK
ncbi:VirB4-like conjugal transfer ATPase, CD1110 family [Nanoarchaeota archaeon]